MRMINRSAGSVGLVAALACGSAGPSESGDGGLPRGDGGLTSADGGGTLVSDDLSERLFVPRFVAPGDTAPRYQRAALFWFGRVTSRDNYVEARLGYGDDRVSMRFVVFDREIYDEADGPDLEAWDSVRLYIDLDADESKTVIDDRSFRIDAQAHRHGTEQTFIYQGESGAWQTSSIPVDGDPDVDTSEITTAKAYRGEDRDQSRGWHVIYHLGYDALGLPGPPDQTGESRWRLAVTGFDRDSLNGDLAGAPQSWPLDFDPVDPSTWALVEFVPFAFQSREGSGSVPGQGQPAYEIGLAAPEHRNPRTLVIREGLDDAIVEDTAVGASEVLCSGNDDYNFGDGDPSWGANTSQEFFHVQNQADYADWPCFARIYLKFPLDGLSPADVIVSAKLTLHHKFPTSGGDQGDWSLVHAFAVDNHLIGSTTEWTETNLSWNLAPTARENLGGFWGDRTGQETTGWDALPAWSWDVTRAVARAQGQSDVSFALYSSDLEYHTGKSFVSSEDFPDWGDPSQRPHLEIVVGDPP